MSINELIRTRLLYNQELGKLFWKEHRSSFLVGKEAGSYDKDGYRFFRLSGKGIKTHRAIWFLETGEWPTKEIHHKNTIRNDNRFSNLEELSTRENLERRKVRTSSGIRGVSRYFHRADGIKGWQVHFNKRWVGVFNCLGLAIKARRKAERGNG